MKSPDRYNIKYKYRSSYEYLLSRKIVSSNNIKMSLLHFPVFSYVSFSMLKVDGVQITRLKISSSILAGADKNKAQVNSVIRSKCGTDNCA